MTLRDFASIDGQLDAIDPDGSIAARGRACIARAPGEPAIDLATIDEHLRAVGDALALSNGVAAREPAAAPVLPVAAATPAPSASVPPPAPPRSIPPPIPTSGASHVAAMLAGAEMTFIPGAQPVPRLPLAEAGAGADADADADADASETSWSKRAEAIPAIGTAQPRTSDVGVDPNLDFDDLFDDFVPPAASAPLSMSPPASEVAGASEPVEEPVAPLPPEAVMSIPPVAAADGDVEELLDDDELEIVLDD